MNQGPKHPNITVEIIGVNGNAFNLLGKATHAMRRAGLSDCEIDEFQTEAMNGDYDHLLRTLIAWFRVS